MNEVTDALIRDLKDTLLVQTEKLLKTVSWVTEEKEMLSTEKRVGKK